jgi:hypothetical protein
MVFNSPALTRSLPYRALALALALTGIQNVTSITILRNLRRQPLYIFRSSGMTKAKDTSARRAPSRAGRSKLVISHNLRRLNVVSR